jgi:riboflavin kinase/FMN adenylyltransferase
MLQIFLTINLANRLLKLPAVRCTLYAGMRVIETLSNFAIKDCVLTIGNFDGVHIGHQEILGVAGRTAEAKKTALVLLTFEPHPLAVLCPEKTPGILTPSALKGELLAKLGVDCMVVLESTQKLLGLSAEDFSKEFVIGKIQPSVVVEGDDFNFGSGRSGSVHTLQKVLVEKGIEVIIVGSRQANLGGRTVEVSSTVIRRLLTEGQVREAAIELGRPYRLIGRVVPGRGRGKKLGFPTVNMNKTTQLVPAEGVYAGTVGVEDTEKGACAASRRIPAVFSIGKLPTYGDSREQLIEAHLLTANVGDLYGRWMAMDFIERIRNQEKFKTEKELATQIAQDCKKARATLTALERKRLTTKSF